MRNSSKEDSHLRLVDFCITQLWAESDEEEEEEKDSCLGQGLRGFRSFRL